MNNSERRKEIARLTDHLEREKEIIEKRLRELYGEDDELWFKEQDLLTERSERK